MGNDKEYGNVAYVFAAIGAVVIGLCIWGVSILINWMIEWLV